MNAIFCENRAFNIISQKVPKNEIKRYFYKTQKGALIMDIWGNFIVYSYVLFISS